MGSKEMDHLKLHVLGTGTAMVTHYYNTCFALDDGKALFLVDGGGGDGILRRFQEMGLSFQNCHHAFLSHEHTDHFLGMVWVLRKIAHSMRFGEYEGDFYLYCHDVLKVKVHTVCQMILQPAEYALFGKRIFITTVNDGETRQILGRDVTFFDIHSRKAKQYGFLMEYETGKKLVFLGDEPVDKDCEHYIQGADWLLSEAFCLSAEEAYYHPKEYHHATVTESAQNAQRLAVDHLVLWHTEDETTFGRRKELYLEEAQAHYDGIVFVPDDGDVLCLE